MRRRPLMSSLVMTINIFIIFIGCWIISYLLVGIVESKILDFIINNTDNNATRYWVYFFVKCISNITIIVLSVKFAIKFSFDYFVCYKDEGEKVFKNCIIGLAILLVYNSYSFYNSMIRIFQDFDEEKQFISTQTLVDFWNNLQGNIKLIYLVLNILIAIGIWIYMFRNKQKMLDRCDFRI